MDSDPFKDTPGPAAGPWTSHAAAKAAAVRVGTDKYRILNTLHQRELAIIPGEPPGLTAHELAAANPPMLAPIAAARLGDLLADGYVHRPGGERVTDTGRPAQLWQITVRGIQALKAAAGALQRHQDLRRPPSELAARRRPPSRPSRRGLRTAAGRVLEALVDVGAVGGTAYELSVVTGELRTSVGDYLRRFVAAGYAIRTSRTRRTDRNAHAFVYEVTEAGIEHLQTAR